jgi:hypothetical protein
MSEIDQQYQKSVDDEADKLLKLSVSEFLKIGPYGSIETIINGKSTSIGWWHYEFENNLHHVLFKTTRKILLGFTKVNLSGVKLENGEITKLSDKELADYD